MPHINKNGISICYETFGNPNHPAMILIMGIGGQLIHWTRKFTQQLVDRGYFVITFDNRDAGLSTIYKDLETPELMTALSAQQRGESVTPPYTLKDMATDITFLMDGLHIKKAHIVGLSMGGMIAQVFAIEYPERVLTLTCIATTSGAPELPPSKPEVMQFFLLPRKEAADANAYVENLMQIYKLYNHPDHYDLKHARDIYASAYQRAYHPDGFKRQLLAIVFSEPRYKKLQQIQAPSLVIHGDYDPVFPLAHGKYLAENIPNARLAMINKMGHALPECLYTDIVNLIAAHAK